MKKFLDWLKSLFGKKPQTAATLPRMIDDGYIIPQGVSGSSVAPVTPAPAPAPAAPATPGSSAPAIDYAQYKGLTKFEVLIYKLGGVTPAGWDWEAAYAAGVVRPDPAPSYSGGSAPAADRWAGVLALAVSSIQFWKGAAGTSSDLSLPIPTGWRGVVELMCGESSQAGEKCNAFALSVLGPDGQTLASSGAPGPYANLSFTVDKDLGAVTVRVSRQTAGAGYVQVNPHSA